jgi:hypothetical protein
MIVVALACDDGDIVAFAPDLFVPPLVSIIMLLMPVAGTEPFAADMNDWKSLPSGDRLPVSWFMSSKKDTTPTLSNRLDMLMASMPKVKTVISFLSIITSSIVLSGNYKFII